MTVRNSVTSSACGGKHGGFCRENAITTRALGPPVAACGCCFPTDDAIEYVFAGGHSIRSRYFSSNRTVLIPFTSVVSLLSESVVAVVVRGPCGARVTTHYRTLGLTLLTGKGSGREGNLRTSLLWLLRQSLISTGPLQRRSQTGAPSSSGRISSKPRPHHMRA